jgi:hypothetical protein
MSAASHSFDIGPKMTKEERKLSTENTIEATGSIVGLMPKIAGFVVGLSGLAFIVGWLEASAFYQEFGAEWVLPLLSSTQIIRTSVSLISLIALSTLLSVYGLTQGIASEKGIRRWGFTFGGLAISALIASFAAEGSLSPSAVNVLAWGAGALMAIFAGLTIGELVARLATDKLFWGKHHIWLLQYVVVFGLVLAPNTIGRAHSKMKSDPFSSRLPTVSFSSPGVHGEWRLVGAVGDRLLLVSLASKKENRRFKLAGASDISEIFATEVK